MKTKILYLSLPITGCEMQSIVTAKEAQQKLQRSGFQVLNPHDAKNHLEDTLGRVAFEHEIMGADLFTLSRCDAMILMPGWERSKGCNLEVRFALDYNIDIYEYPTMRKMHFKSQLINKLTRTTYDHWITQPIHIEEPTVGMLN